MTKATRLASLAPVLFASAVLAAAGACANDPRTQSAGALVEVLGVTRLQARDPKALADWYSTRFRLTFKADGGGYVSTDETALGPLTVAIDPAQEGRAPQPIHIFFFVRNLDRVLGQLSDVGTSPRRIETDKDGRPKAIVDDPEGNEIELVQR